VAIDGEVEGGGWKMALEIKTPGDDILDLVAQFSKEFLWLQDACVLMRK